MNIYQRPLFRQAGGPVAPPMAAPQMAAPEAAIGQAGAEASAGMQQVGLDYLAQTMGGIDAATDAKSLIDALRGNNKPIEARYAELAQLVGEQDARQTPESVLALVQPAIMMTEQGAVDSGIGELMQNVVGQVEMETEGGAPTPMAGGVGSLMMAGAPQAEVGQPPVQNFRNGGLVQRFQVGGEAQGRLGQLYSEMLPVYQSVLGPGGSEEAKAQALFAIAQAAGQFAAGRGPQGEDLRGASPAAAFAANLGGLSGSLQQQAGARAQEERALRLAALQGAQQEYSAERAAARAAAGRETPLGSFYDILDAEGNVVDTVPIATRADFVAVQARVPEGGTFRPAFREAAKPEYKEVDGVLYNMATDPPTPVIKPKSELVTLVNPENNQVLYNVLEGGEAYNQARNSGYVPLSVAKNVQEVVGAGVASGETINIQMEDGTVYTVRRDSERANELLAQPGAREVSVTAAKQQSIFTNVDLMNAYAADQTSPEQNAEIWSAIAEASKQVYSPEQNAWIRPELPRQVTDAENSRARLGAPTQLPITISPAEGIADAEVEIEKLSQDVSDALNSVGGSAFGTPAFVLNMINLGAGLANLSSPAQETQEALARVETLNETAKVAFRNLTAGRAAQESVNAFEAILPKTKSVFTSTDRAAEQIRSVIGFFASEVENAEQALNRGVASPSERLELEQAIIGGRAMIKSYNALLEGTQKVISGGAPVDLRQFLRP